MTVGWVAALLCVVLAVGAVRQARRAQRYAVEARQHADRAWRNVYEMQARQESGGDAR